MELRKWTLIHDLKESEAKFVMTWRGRKLFAATYIPKHHRSG
tara:strand:+ start:2684 stop:2809 length:126 start_codon:yes stop_codon:yes gene_type:complete